MGNIRPAMTPEHIEQINKLIEVNPDWNRSRLSRELCKTWDWRGENGQIKDISCRDVLRALDAAGKIKLPERVTNGRLKGSTEKIVPMLHDMTPIEGLLAELLPEMVKVRLFQCFNDAMVSEQTARMVAMKAATDAAGDMIRGLTQRMNRARQSQITLELLDIVAGAEALA